MKKIAMEIGQRIKALRIQNNLTQQELADKLHYKSRSTINKIELGINEMHPTKVYAFAMALNSEPAYILGYVDENDNKLNKIVITFANSMQKTYICTDEQVEQIIKIVENSESGPEK